MPKVRSLSEFFPGLENIPIENIITHIGGKVNPTLLGNNLCNRIIYSQTVPTNNAELVMDLAILKEALKMHPGEYYNQNNRSILIPQEFLERFPDIPATVRVFIDIFAAPGITFIFLKGVESNPKSLGTVLIPSYTKDSAVSLTLADKTYEIKAGEIKIIPAPTLRADIKFSSKNAALLGKHELTTEVVGGEFGIAVDMQKA